jgi:hypothetical protein
MQRWNFHILSALGISKRMSIKNNEFIKVLLIDRRPSSKEINSHAARRFDNTGAIVDELKLIEGIEVLSLDLATISFEEVSFLQFYIILFDVKIAFVLLY